MELPGRFLSPVFERKRECGSSFLAVGDSAGCLPISMPFLFPFATSILVLPWQVMGCIPRARKEAVLFPGTPPPRSGEAGKGPGVQVCGRISAGLNIQKTKIMASGPITSWEIDGENSRNSVRLYFWGLQNHCRL